MTDSISAAWNPDCGYSHCPAACTESILTLDMDGTVSACNRFTEQLLGCSESDVVGRSFVSLIGTGKERFHEVLSAVFQGKTGHLEVGIKSLNEAEIPVSLSIALSRARKRSTPHIAVICHDLRPLRTLEIQLHERDQFFASIVRNSADAIITLDTEERVTSWNKGAEAIYGYSEAEMLGHQLNVLIPDDLGGQAELDQISMAVRADGYLRSHQADRLRKDGQRIKVIFTRTAIKDQQGNVVGFSTVIKDITHQKLAERHLAQMEKLSAIGEVAAGLAHEIKNPLAGIKGAIEIIHDGMPEGHSHRLILSDVLAEVSRIDRAVMNLLSYSRPRNPNWARVDVVRLVQNVFSLIQTMADSRQIELQLISHADTLTIIGDENELRQLFMNLFLNSLEAIEKRGRITVRFKHRSDHRVQISVEDTGPGVTSEMATRVFQPFYTTKTHGTGLGLATCKRIVTDHGGDIHVQNKRAGGAQFMIELPIGTASNGISSNEAAGQGPA